MRSQHAIGATILSQPRSTRRSMRNSCLSQRGDIGKMRLESAMHFIQQKFLQVDGPTWLVALVLYGAWLLLVWFNAVLPWWVIMPAGAYLLAWHFSLQHEAIHSFRGVPAWLRFAVVFPPLGLWFPFLPHRKSHTTH